MKYHSTNPAPQDNISERVYSNIFSENVKCEWDVSFIEKDVMKGNPLEVNTNFINITNASNYMDIKSLLNLLCVKVACMIKGKNLNEINKMFSQDE